VVGRGQFISNFGFSISDLFDNENKLIYMERDELIKLVKRITLFDGSEKEVDIMIGIFLKNVPDPNALAYLHEKEYEHFTAEQIVDKALAYKPFIL
jgi:hypothetical protein